MQFISHAVNSKTVKASSKHFYSSLKLTHTISLTLRKISRYFIQIKTISLYSNVSVWNKFILLTDHLVYHYRPCFYHETTVIHLVVCQLLIRSLVHPPVKSSCAVWLKMKEHNYPQLKQLPEEYKSASKNVVSRPHTRFHSNRRDNYDEEHKKIAFFNISSPFRLFSNSGIGKQNMHRLHWVYGNGVKIFQPGLISLSPS